MGSEEKKKSVKEELEFGGPIGTLGIMLGSHLLLYWLWYCLEFNQGKPTAIWVHDLFAKVLTDALPSAMTTATYLGFVFFQFFLAFFMPGITMSGLPVPELGYKTIPYLCNAFSCFYLTLAIIAGLHYTGTFPITLVMDNYGPYLTTAILFGDISCLFLHILAVVTKNDVRMSGNFIYDFFMGAYLNPRIGIVDLKMIAEVRLSWYLLMMVTLSCAMKQYEKEGYVSAAMWFQLLAHWLYTNACSKGEHFIPPTWDMLHEKFGWMLNFWNVAGVPFLYTFQSVYIVKNNPHHSTAHTVGVFCMLLAAYYVWDTANFQKNHYRLCERGQDIRRWTFPVLPWSRLEKPKTIKSKYGTLLADGWMKYGGRKIHYCMDMIMALSWGLNCGFGSFLPYFYCVFFTSFMIHRYARDTVRCQQKYRETWDEYKKECPYVFFPYLF